MNLRIKWLAQIALITGILGSMAYAGDESPLIPPLEKGGIIQKGEVAEEAIKFPDVVATINGYVITGQHMEERIAQSRAMDPDRFDAMSLEDRRMAITRTIDSMVLLEIIYQDAVRKGIVITDEEVDQNLERLKRQFPSEEAFEKAFADARIKIPAWKEETKKNLMGARLENIVVAGIKISDDEIRDFYEKNKKDLNKDAIKISYILVKTEEEAREVIKEFEKEKDFAGLAKKYSIDTLSKDKGGEIGWSSKGVLIKEVEDVAYSLPPGQISAPIESPFGYYITRVDEKKEASGQTLEDHREHVRSILQQIKWQKLRLEWVKTLFNNAVVWKWSP